MDREYFIVIVGTPLFHKEIILQTFPDSRIAYAGVEVVYSGFGEELVYGCGIFIMVHYVCYG